MQCPNCKTENRDDRETCYHCSRDLRMLRLIVNKARMHYNNAIEHAERSRYYDALGEINNALELNSGMREAHVLRGTILARLDRPDEARDAWDQALALDTHTQRAHRYLLQLGNLKRSLPMLTRLRVIVGGAVAISLAALVIVGYALISTGKEIAARSGWEALQAGNYKQAETIAMTLQEDQPVEANELLEAVRLAIDTQLQRAAYYGEAGQFEEALEILQEISRRDLSWETTREIERVRRNIRSSYAQEVQEAYDVEPVTRVSYDLAEAKAEEFLNSYPTDSEIVREARAELLNRVEEQVAEWLQRADTLANTPSRREEVDELLEQAAQYEFIVDRSEQIAAVRDKMRQALITEAFSRVERAVERDDREAYREALEELRAFENVPEAMLAQAREMEQIFAQRARERLYERMQTALERESPEDLIDLAEKYRELTGAVPEEIARPLDEMRRDLAIDYYYSLMGQAEEIETAELSADRGRRIAEMARLARKNLPPRIKAGAQDDLLFFEARGLRAAGREEEAAEVTVELRELNPDSVYLGMLE